MTSRESRTDLEISDVKPRRLTRVNVGTLLDRVKLYRHHYTVGSYYPQHPNSRQGAFRLLIDQLEAATSDAELRRIWRTVENDWAHTHGVTIR